MIAGNDIGMILTAREAEALYTFLRSLGMTMEAMQRLRQAGLLDLFDALRDFSRREQ